MSEQWQPIETAPKSEVVLAWSRDGGYELVWWDEDNSNGPGWGYGDKGYRTSPTHWMYLPGEPDDAD